MIYDDKKFIGSVIRNARKIAGLTQAQLAELVDMSDKNLGNIENGKQFPQVNNFLRILEVLNISVDNFGVNIQGKNEIEVKNDILKKVLSANHKELKAYSIMIHSINKIFANI